MTEAALGAKFEILFHKMLPRVKYLIFYCNLVNILHAGPVAAATKLKVQIRGFFSDGARKVAVLPRVCFSFRKMGA